MYFKKNGKCFKKKIFIKKEKEKIILRELL